MSWQYCSKLVSRSSSSRSCTRFAAFVLCLTGTPDARIRHGQLHRCCVSSQEKLAKPFAANKIPAKCEQHTNMTEHCAESVRQHHSTSSADGLSVSCGCKAQRTPATQTDKSHDKQEGFLLASHPQSVPACMQYSMLKSCQRAQKLMLTDRKNSNNNHQQDSRSATTVEASEKLLVSAVY